MSVAYGTGGIWKGRAEAADRTTEIRPDFFQGPVPEFLLPVALRRARTSSPEVAPAAPKENEVVMASDQIEMEPPRDGAVDKSEVSAATESALAVNPACRSCGGATVGKGRQKSGLRRLRCRSCGKTQNAGEKSSIAPVPCPRCGGPSVRWGRAATGSPVRRCAAPPAGCGKSWTVEKAPPRRRGMRSPHASEALRKVWAVRDSATRSAIGRKAARARLAKQPHSVRSAGSRKAQEPMGPEARRERGRAGARACHALPEDRKRAMIEKRKATCAARRARLAALEGELVYLAAPYSHPDPAVREARFREINRAAGELMAAGTLVYSPISHTHPILEVCGLPKGWEAYDRAMLSRCSRVIVLQLEGWEASVGVAAEIRIAEELGLEVALQPSSSAVLLVAEAPR